MPKMRTMDWDAVAPLNPFDKTAAMVAGKGEHYEPEILPTKVHSSTPLPLKPITAHALAQRDFVDLRNKVIGRLTVMGPWEHENSKVRPWVVRCVCGAYEVRSAKYVKKCLAGNNPGDDEPMCDWCSATRRLRMGRGRGIPVEKRHFNAKAEEVK